MSLFGAYVLAQTAAAEPVQRISREFGRENWWFWAIVCLGCLSLCGWWYRHDTRELGRFWRVVLFGLRAAVWIGLLCVFLDPQERTESEIVRPSRIAILVDTSASMGFPARTNGTETAAAGSRIETVRSILESGPLIQELRRKHEIETYSFDSKLTSRGTISRLSEEKEAAERPDLNWKEWLTSSGQETRLGESLLQLIRETSGETLAGVVVFTDGASNGGIETSNAHAAAVASGTRIVTIGLGNTDKPANLQVQTVQAPTHAHVGDGFTITAFLTGQGLSGQNVTVELLGKDERATSPMTVLQTKQATILEDGIPVGVSFRFDTKDPGRRIFNVRAMAGESVREFTLSDNEKPLPPIEITDRRTRVLLLAGGPMRDYQFVRNLYFRDRGMELHILLQSGDPQISQEAEKVLTKFPATREELFEYDVIVAFDPDWKAIQPGELELITEWLFQHAGGLILVAGDVNTPNLVLARNDLQQVQSWYPVVLPRFYDPELLGDNSQQPWPIRLTREGGSSEFLNLNDGTGNEPSIWENFSGLYRCFPDEGIKPGGAVLAEHSDPRSIRGKNAPALIASQFFGAGRVLYIGSAEFWRLRAIDESYYDRFWIKALREVGQGRLLRGSTRGLILLERSTYPLGSSVVVRGRVLDAQYQPLVQDRLSAELLDPRGQVLLSGLELNKIDERPGEYQGAFLAALPGRYRIKFNVPQSTEDVIGYVQVEVPNYEYLHPEQNQSELKRLATVENGGAYLTTEEAVSKLIELLPDQTSTKVQFDIPRPLWDRGWVMGLLVGFLATEWLLRKLLKLA